MEGPAGGGARRETEARRWRREAMADGAGGIGRGHTCDSRGTREQEARQGETEDGEAGGAVLGRRICSEKGRGDRRRRTRESGSRPWRRGGELLALAAGCVCVRAAALAGGRRGHGRAAHGRIAARRREQRKIEQEVAAPREGKGRWNRAQGSWRRWGDAREMRVGPGRGLGLGKEWG